MASREERQRELEAIFRSSPDGSNRIIQIYMRAKGELPPMGSFVVQDVIPAILDAEFPPPDGESPP